MTQEVDDVLRVGDQDALDAAAAEFFRSELTKARQSFGRRFAEKFVLAALESLDWVGVLASAGIASGLDGDDARAQILRMWLDQHAEKFGRVQALLQEMSERFEVLGADVMARVESEEYLQIVRKAFRAWDRAETVRGWKSETRLGLPRALQVHGAPWRHRSTMLTRTC